MQSAAVAAEPAPIPRKQVNLAEVSAGWLRTPFRAWASISSSTQSMPPTLPWHQEEGLELVISEAMSPFRTPT